MDKNSENEKPAQVQRPWDEVSLPGAGATEQPTILQVFNQVNTDDESKPITATATLEHVHVVKNACIDERELHSKVSQNNQNAQHVSPSVIPTDIEDVAAPRTNIESDNLVSSLSKEPSDSQILNNNNNNHKLSHQTSTSATVEPPEVLKQPNEPQSTNVFDIESHLIETFDEYDTKEESVGINELPPIKAELTQGSSKIETDSNVRSVIEVEPVGSIRRKPVQTLLQPKDPQQYAKFKSTTIEIETELETETELKLQRAEDISAEIKATADKLVQEIEQQVLETLRAEIGKAKGEDLEIETTTLLKEPTQTNHHNISEEATTLPVEKTEESLTETADINTNLSQKVDEQLSEVTSILKGAPVSVNASAVAGEAAAIVVDQSTKLVDLNGLPSPNTVSEEENRKLFIESLPQIAAEESDASKLASDCKREYYQSLRKYLVQNNTDKPPVPLQTYRWEDLRRAKERGGYPWTHLYKRPLESDEEPEIVLLLRKSQELRFTSESPKSLKKVRYDEQVLVKETERYIQELSEEEEADDHATDSGPPTTEDEECHSLQSESISCVSDSVLAVGKPRKSKRLGKLRGILKNRKSVRATEDAQSLPATSVNNSRHQSNDNLSKQTQLLANGHDKTPRCFSIMKKLRSMADRQKKRLNIKRISLKKDDQIILSEETKILRLKSSPKSERGEIPHFIEKQDSDDVDVDVLEIVELDESPSRKRKDDGRDSEDREKLAAPTTTVVQPDEIIEITNELKSENGAQTPEPTVSEILEEEIKSCTTTITEDISANEPPPRKTPRLRREHVYEEIDQNETIGDQINEILEMASVAVLKQSLLKQDDSVMKDLDAANKPIPLDRMGSSEEEQISAVETKTNLLAPISSIDSTSSDEDRARSQLSPVAEESDVASVDGHIDERATTIPTNNVELNETINTAELKPSIKKESSPAPSDKKVTFSHVEDEAESHREDIELPEEVVQEAAAKRWKNMSDHEYEPIGEPLTDEQTIITKEPSPAPQQVYKQHDETQEEMEIGEMRDELKEAEEQQKDMEERYFSSVTTTPRTESRTDYDIHTSQVDTSALEELPLKPENRRKGFMASAQDRTRKMQAGIKTQAGKIKTKLRSPTKKPPSDSPKAKERKRFKAPEFSKMKMPEIKRPEMSKLKDFKRPEFTKFNKPDMSKFKLPEKFSTLKLRRSKSFKENEPVHDEVITDETTTNKPSANAEAIPQKKMFEFNFGTYPRAFRRNKKPVEQESSVFTGTGTGTGTEEPSVIPSTETQPSIESSSSPQGDRGPGPVRSRWADKFSDVSYNDSEGSRYRRYGSEQESFDRESSLERRMREDLEEAPSEDANLGIMAGVTDNRQFADFDEENRAIHEISNLRAGEFKRRPMVHQDSDLVSEESKDAVGWTDKEIQKNKLLRKAELEAEASYFNYPLEERMTQDAQSTASSGKKVVMEEIDDDEFFLRKRGVSEDNIQLRQYISSAIREGFDMPINALQHVGQTSEPMDYGDYDVPPPKPRRLHKHYQPEDVSQEFEMHHSEFEDDISVSHNGSDFFGAPKRPMRKGRSRSKYSMDSQDVPMPEAQHHEQYFDDDEEYLRPPRAYNKEHVKDVTKDFSSLPKSVEQEVDSEVIRPAAPRRRKRQQRESSMDKDSYINGFGGRSVSHTYLQTPEDVIVYRTEHEYHIPLATPENYTDGTSATSRKSRSISRYEEDDRTSRGADSFAMDQIMKIQQETELDAKAENERTAGYVQEKFIIDMMENDGYAVVRKEHLPKPTPPARRKKFSRSPGERFATMPNMRTKRGSPVPPERPPPPRSYTQTESITPLRESALSLEESQNIEDDYEELQHLDDERPESPRNLQSGDIINKMKYRPLPPPPRPPREKRQRGPYDKGLTQDDELDDDSNFDDRDGGGERIATSSTADSYDQNGDFEDGSRFVEVEVSTQTDPLPDDFVCEEFEITDDMKVIEPRKFAKTLEDMLAEERPLTEDEQLARGLQRFRDANQRSISEKSRASSKSQSRPQTPSAVVIERRVSTPIPNRETAESMLEAALIVRPIDDLDLEEEALRREGLLTDSSQQSKSDKDSRYQEEEQIIASNLSLQPSSTELEEAIEGLKSQVTSERDTEDDKEVERTMQEHSYEYPRIEEEILRRLKKLDEEELRAKQKLIEATESSEEIMPPTSYKDELRDEIIQQPIEFDYEQKVTREHEKHEETPQNETPQEEAAQAPPQPPPRRRSSITIEPIMLALSEQPKTQEVVPQQLETAQPTFPIHMAIADLEVDRLRVHALQAEQIMVSQLHGKQITSDDLECKSGNLVVNNIELPSGFIEDIVERVRSSERSQLHAVETQTSRQASDEALSVEQLSPPPVLESVPPPKPPRQRVVEAAAPTSLQSTSGTPLQESSQQRLHDFQEEDTTNQSTQTLETPTTTSAPPPPNVFPTVEYLQSLAPLAFYNLRNLEADADISQRRRRHHRRSRESSPSEEDDGEKADSEDINTTEQVTKSHRHRTRSSTRPAEPQSVAQAGRQFVSACSLSLVNIINQLTESVRGKTATDLDSTTRERQVPTMVVLFIILTFVILLFLLSGKSIHHHHWDFFNPPGNNGRLS